MNYKEKREQRFKKICSHFENEMLSTLLCCVKIDSKLFEKLSNAVSNYLHESKKYRLQNKTPNGMLVPKSEIENQFNDVIIAYRDILLSLNFSKILSLWSIPVIRYKEPGANSENKNNPMRSELPHSDTWIGWDKNSIIINIPVLGDTDGNRVNFFKHPEDIDESWVQKQKSFEEGAKKFSGKCNLIKPHYNKGYIYIADISVIHQTHRNLECDARVSLDMVKYVDFPKKGDFGIDNTLTYDEIISIGLKNKLTTPLKMGEIIGKSGYKRSTKFKLSKL